MFLKTRSDHKKVNVVTLGCSKNLVDSENIVTQLKANNVDAEHQSIDSVADIVVINTCGFIEAAKQESIDTILAYAKLKEEGSLEKLYVTGCLSHRYKDELQRAIPEVDAYFGTLELPGLLQKFNADYKHELVGDRIILTPHHYAYLKISEGCNRTCAFCAIPLMRGKHRSKSIRDLVAQAEGLVARGVKEIILIAQELTYYGLDRYKKRKLADLLDQLSDIEGLQWIRLHYAYPANFPREVFQIMRTKPNICNYLDMPLQHANNAILHAMRRQITQEETWELIQYARSEVPDLALRTTMLVGFPGETEAAFEQLCQFVSKVRFDRLGVFEYSHEEGTIGYQLPDDVPHDIKCKRATKLMDIQKQISLEINERKIGSIVNVLVDRKEGGFYYGRTEHDSPEVDNEVIIDGTQDLSIGDFAPIKIQDVTEYDLFGVLAEA